MDNILDKGDYAKLQDECYDASADGLKVREKTIGGVSDGVQVQTCTNNTPESTATTPTSSLTPVLASSQYV